MKTKRSPPISVTWARLTVNIIYYSTVMQHTHRHENELHVWTLQFINEDEISWSLTLFPGPFHVVDSLECITNHSNDLVRCPSMTSRGFVCTWCLKKLTSLCTKLHSAMKLHQTITTLKLMSDNRIHILRGHVCTWLWNHRVEFIESKRAVQKWSKNILIAP